MECGCEGVRGVGCCDPTGVLLRRHPDGRIRSTLDGWQYVVITAQSAQRVPPLLMLGFLLKAVDRTSTMCVCAALLSW